MPGLLLVARAKRSTIAKVLGPVFAVFALVAGQIHPWWLTLLLVIALGITTAVGVVLTELALRWRAKPTLFAGSPEGTAALAVERNAVDRAGGKFWWRDLGEPEWFEDLLMLWRKDHGTSVDRASYSVDQRPLRDHLPASASVPAAIEKPKKASLVGATGLLTDEFTTIQVMRHDYHLALYTETHLEDYLKAVPNTTCFGAEGWVPLPANLAVHAIVELRDHWVLLNLRRPAADYHPLTWSASFEEQLDLVGQSGLADHTVGDTLRRGLSEEFGFDPDAIRQQVLLSIAIERVRESQDDGSVRVVSAGALVCAARLAVSVDEAFATLADRSKAPDLEEHVGWMALRMAKPSDVSALLAATEVSSSPRLSPDFVERHDKLGIPVRVHPASQRRTYDPHFWHPTSRQRLYLWSRWTQVL